MRVFALVLALVAGASASVSGGTSNFGAASNNRFGDNRQGAFDTGRGVAYNSGTGGFNTGGSSVGVDTFGDPFSFGSTSGGFQQGTATAQIRDQFFKRGQDQVESQSRHLDNVDAGRGRLDNQIRRGNARENAYNNEENQSQGSQSHENRDYDQNYDQWAESNQQQHDVNDKHVNGLDHVGRYDRKDIARNSGEKALSNNRNAIYHNTHDNDDTAYKYLRNFDSNIRQRGGFKENVGQDNTNTDIVEENQSDSRFSRGEKDLFRRTDSDDAFRKESDWTSNQGQKQSVNNQFGAVDHLQNAAEQKDLDRNSVFDKKNDLFWHRDTAQDKATRQANDIAEKKSDQQKKALAEATGQKHVSDNKFYDGSSYGKGTGGRGGNPSVGLGTGATGVVVGVDSDPVYGTGSGGRVVGTGLATTGNQAGTGFTNPGGVKGTREGSGGDYKNLYNEGARQADLANQDHSNRAESDAVADNYYNRGRNVDDIVEINGQREGKWAKDKAGLRNSNNNGFNGADAEAAKAAELADNAVESRKTSSNLDAANKNLQAKELNRVNYRKNLVDSKQVVRKDKKFYFDKAEDGNSNEALAYDRNKGSKDTGEEQQANRESRTRYNNAADDAKANQQARSYNNLDARQISNADAFAKQSDNSAGWQNEKKNADANAQKHNSAFDHGRQVNEFDSFSRNNNLRNQKLWDQARRDIGQKAYGKENDRQVDASFVFAPDTRNNNNLGLGNQRSTFGGGGGGTTFRGGNTGRNNDYGNTRGTTFGSSSFDAPLGGFMSSNFGSSDFGRGSRTYGNDLYANSNNQGGTGGSNTRRY